MPHRLRRLLFGPPKDVQDPSAFHKVSLVALLAWVGLGADGLSSSAYGPDEAYRALGEHTGLAFFLALATAATVFIISYGYARIIEHFPSGGGGYVVASKLLGPRTGVLSGAALLVDYVLTITTSMVGGADAVFSFLPPSWHGGKLPVVMAGLLLLAVLNIRGVKESISLVVPIFVAFVVTHLLALGVAIGGHAQAFGETAGQVRANVAGTTASLGTLGALTLFARAYSLGGGTYTGIEAVSNGVGIMREPRVRTAKRTMALMAVSLAVTASGILLSYLLLHARPEPGKTMNAVLLQQVASSWTLFGVPVGSAFTIVTLVSEGALLFLAAQAGFLDGPRVMANMATDSWLPHRFAALSDRLTMRNGVIIMALLAAAALVYSRGNISTLLVMYAINVFLTFSLSNLAMARFWVKNRADHPGWWRHLPAHVLALGLCALILVVTVFEKFREGGWVTLLVTAGTIGLCHVIRRHYALVRLALQQLDLDLPSPPEVDAPEPSEERAPIVFERGAIRGLREHHAELDPDPKKPVAILFVGGYSGLGRHALMTLLRMFPYHFDGVVFVSVAVVDSESFKGQGEIARLEEGTREHLLCYERFARTLGLRAGSAFAVGTEVPAEAERTAEGLVREYPRALFVAGQLMFEEDTLMNRVLHNETAIMVQQRLQRHGIPMIVVPVRIDLATRRTLRAPAAAPAPP
jgi:amino acid transporter